MVVLRRIFLFMRWLRLKLSSAEVRRRIVKVMTIKLELLNWMTGILLVAAGGVEAVRGRVPEALNWIIFGSMYLVMDDYKSNPSPVTKTEWLTHISRTIFSWVGLFGALFITVYFCVKR